MWSVTNTMSDSSFDRGDGAGMAGVGLFCIVLVFLYVQEYQLALILSGVICAMTIAYYHVTNNE